ncbi:hypothetical protein [Nonomuraea sp. NPDC049784]|uniref:hypothetical protein n=1 Tax=Nonomuraea sp. NPDC049784 TaxID=3154361 RepID=UPI0033D45E38
MKRMINGLAATLAFGLAPALVAAPAAAAPGPDTCRQGFVWRTARPSDLVCVEPTVRDRVHRDNMLTRGRWTDGVYGPHTCLVPYVWREAFVGDDVCVQVGQRTQARQDNLQADDRRVLARLQVTATTYAGVRYAQLNGDHFNLGKVELFVRNSTTRKLIYRATVTASRHNGLAGGSFGVMTTVTNCTGKPGVNAYATAYDTLSGRWSTPAPFRYCARFDY